MRGESQSEGVRTQARGKGKKTKGKKRTKIRKTKGLCPSKRIEKHTFKKPVKSHLWQSLRSSVQKIPIFFDHKSVSPYEKFRKLPLRPTHKIKELKILDLLILLYKTIMIIYLEQTLVRTNNDDRIVIE